MTTEEGFLRAILDDINDASRRLVFADWLEEGGDARAEWLRIDCELATLRPKDRRRPALETRRQKLGEAHRESLIVWERRFTLARIKEKASRAPTGMISHGTYMSKSKHEGRLNPVLSEKKLAAFEKKHRITLPEEYRSFLLEVGNGGLGPGDGLASLAEAVKNSPSCDLDKPFPFSRRQWEQEGISFQEEFDPDKEYDQPGVLYLATISPFGYYAHLCLVITGEDRGRMWGYGLQCGWTWEAPTHDEEGPGVDDPRSFFRWYEDWLDVILSKENAGRSE